MFSVQLMQQRQIFRDGKPIMPFSGMLNRWAAQQAFICFHQGALADPHHQQTGPQLKGPAWYRRTARSLNACLDPSADVTAGSSRISCCLEQQTGSRCTPTQQHPSHTQAPLNSDCCTHKRTHYQLMHASTPSGVSQLFAQVVRGHVRPVLGGSAIQQQQRTQADTTAGTTAQTQSSTP